MLAERGKVIVGVEAGGRGGRGIGGDVKTGGVCIWIDLCQKSSESNLGRVLGNQRSTRWGCNAGCEAIS